MVLQPGSSSQALARGTRFYLGRIFRRPYPYVVLAYVIIVPATMAAFGAIDTTKGWTKVLIDSFPVVYLAPVVAAGLGGKIGFEDGPGFRASLPSLGLTVGRQYSAAAAAFALASVTVVGGGLVAGSVAVRVVLESSTQGILVDDLAGVQGFVVIALGLILLVYTYAIIEFVAGRLFDLPGRTVGWLLGINTVTAFLPIGIEIFGPRVGNLGDHVVLWAICMASLFVACLVGKRLEA